MGTGIERERRLAQPALGHTLPAAGTGQGAGHGDLIGGVHLIERLLGPGDEAVDLAAVQPDPMAAGAGVDLQSGLSLGSGERYVSAARADHAPGGGGTESAAA